VRVKIGDLDRGRLFEQGLLLEIGRDEASSTLVRIFFDQIASDSARLIDDEAVVILVIEIQSWVSVPVSNSCDSTHDVRNLAEWLDLEVLWGLVCALGKINGDELVGDLLLFADQGNETGASGLGVTVEFDDHDYSGAWTR
jgi:hypothetical protein